MTRSVETRSAGLVWMPLRTGFPKNPKTKKQTNQKNRFLSSWPWGEKSLFTLNLPHCGLNMKAHSYIHHFWSSSSGFLQRLKYIPWFVIIYYYFIILYYFNNTLEPNMFLFFMLHAWRTFQFCSGDWVPRLPQALVSAPCNNHFGVPEQFLSHSSKNAKRGQHQLSFKCCSKKKQGCNVLKLHLSVWLHKSNTHAFRKL